MVRVRLDDPLPAARSQIDASPYGFAIVIAGTGTVLGRLRRSSLDGASDATVDAVMEPGPSTVRPDQTASDVLERLRRRQLTSAIVTNPAGRLLGVVKRGDLETALRSSQQ